MASVDSSQYGSTIAQVGTGPAGDCKALFGTVDLASAQSGSDTVNFFTAPAGFMPLFGFLVGEDIDTGTETYELDIGISGDTTKYLDSGVISGDAVTGIKPETGIWMPLLGDLMTGAPTAFTSETDIIGTVTAAANAGGTGRLTLIVIGTYQDYRAA